MSLLWILGLVLVAIGFAGVILPLLPGVPLMFAGMWLAAYADDYTRVGAGTLVVLGTLAAVTLIVDLAAGAFGAQRVGASRQAVTGAALGTVVGLFLGLPGLLLGPFVGAVVGELMAAGGTQRALSVGMASWLAFVLGTLVKLAVAFAMVGIFLFALLWRSS